MEYKSLRMSRTKRDGAVNNPVYFYVIDMESMRSTVIGYGEVNGEDKYFFFSRKINAVIDQKWTARYQYIMYEEDAERMMEDIDKFGFKWRLLTMSSIILSASSSYIMYWYLTVHF